MKVSKHDYLKEFPIMQCYLRTPFVNYFENISIIFSAHLSPLPPPPLHNPPLSQQPLALPLGISHHQGFHTYGTQYQAFFLSSLFQIYLFTPSQSQSPSQLFQFSGFPSKHTAHNLAQFTLDIVGHPSNNNQMLSHHNAKFDYHFLSPKLLYKQDTIGGTILNVHSFY